MLYISTLIFLATFSIAHLCHHCYQKLHGIIFIALDWIAITDEYHGDMLMIFPLNFQPPLIKSILLETHILLLSNISLFSSRYWTTEANAISFSRIFVAPQPWQTTNVLIRETTMLPCSLRDIWHLLHANRRETLSFSQIQNPFWPHKL